MRAILLILILIVCGGCDLAESAVSNINGWDLSACIDGYDVCWELYTDNSDRFDNGFVAGMDALSTVGEGNN